jgi:hypothetical protein
MENVLQVILLVLGKTEATCNDAQHNALAAWTEFKALDKQQTFHIQSNTQTNLDLWNTNVGHGFQFKHRNPRKFAT